MILFHSYNNDILNTYIDKIITEDKMDGLIKDSWLILFNKYPIFNLGLNEKNKIEEFMKNLDNKYVL